MKVAEKILTQIQSISEDSTFGYEQLNITKSEYLTAAKALERLIKKGIIRKLSKGTFYKPKKTIFGELRPGDTEILRPYLFSNGKRVAYITGTYLYNQLYLTTQMAFRIKIASLSKRIYINTGAIKATPVKSYAQVTDDNYSLLGYLDAMKDLKIIPDLDIQSAVGILINIVEKLTAAQTAEIIKYALLYPPRVRALLGAILEQLNRKKGIEKLKETLNPLTGFKLGLRNTKLKTASNWGIQ
ncbi:MAG: hypothetical protein IPH11_02875 [Ignavibacteriales bacterium]|nr:hypothetical protein [Ignavibacteriales bacterium]